MSRKPDSIYKKKEPNFQVLKEIRFQSERKTAKVTRPTYRAGSSSSYALEEGQDSSRKGDGKLTVLQLLYCQSGGLGTNTGGTIMGRQRMTMLPLVHACRSLDENWKQISRRIGSRKTRASFVIDVQTRTMCTLAYVPTLTFSRFRDSNAFLSFERQRMHARSPKLPRNEGGVGHTLRHASSSTWKDLSGKETLFSTVQPQSRQLQL